jgi:hypothetical protein
MVMTVQEEKELLILKHGQQLELLKLKRDIAFEEHTLKMQRLEKLLEISRFGSGTKSIEKMAEDT